MSGKSNKTRIDGAAAVGAEQGAVKAAAGGIRNRVREVRTMRLGDLRPHPGNWRAHPQAQRDAMRGVLEELGWAGVVLAYEPEDGGGLMTLDGHLRAEEAPDLEVSVAVLDIKDREAAYLLATHDPLSALADANSVALDALLRDVNSGMPAVQEMLAGLAEDAGLYPDAPEVVEDEVPEPPTSPVTETGDVWILGRHRLLCGDSADAASVSRVCGNVRATCVFTDPPYGVSIGAKNRLLNANPSGENGNTGNGRVETNIADDDLSPAELKARLIPAFKNLAKVCAPDCTYFVCAPQVGELGMMMMMMMQESGLPVRHVLIWKKNQPTFSMGRLDYDYQHEPILLTWRKNHKRPMRGTHKTSVWEIDKPRESKMHPTMKPVALYANAYLNNGDPGDAVFDIYAGSGTAFIAAEQTGRTCVGIEINPAYCDVIVERWQNLTGQKATRERHGTP